MRLSAQTSQAGTKKIFFSHRGKKILLSVLSVISVAKIFYRKMAEFDLEVTKIPWGLVNVYRA
jgi:hypothetical protein